MKHPLRTMRFRWRADDDLLSIADYREAARRRLPRMVWPYIDGAAEDAATMDANRCGFGRWTFRPKVFTGKAGNALTTDLFDTRLSMPLFLAPTGMSGMAHWSGEPAGARAAERAGIRACISTGASYTPEEIAEATDEAHFFQLYPWGEEGTDGRTLTGELMDRAWTAGYRTLFLTADVPIHGNREKERRHGLTMQPLLTPARLIDLARHARWSRDYWRHARTSPRLMMELLGASDLVQMVRRQVRVMRPELCWEDARWMRDRWRGHFVIKGLLHPDDAEAAIAIGADGVVVSNHGGRQLDGALGAIDALPDIVARVAGRVPVLLDGGIRRGADIVKALCLGATAVGIGRPWLYGLAVKGEAGVDRILAILREEMVRTLTLLGCSGPADLTPDRLVRTDRL